MANIIKSPSQLKKDYKQVKRINLLWFTILIGSILAFPYYQSSIVIVLLSVYVIILRNKKTQILKAGVTGEKAATKVFKKLSNEYTVFHDLTVTYDGRQSQIDHVIVGPTGIYIVETKNIKGKVSGNIKDNQWTITKTGRKGGVYSKKMYNPVKQVGTHVYRLSNMLRDNKVHAWVQGIIYFSNEESIVSIEDSEVGDIPIFSAKNKGTNKLLKYISKNSTEISQAKQEKAIKVLKKVVS